MTEEQWRPVVGYEGLYEVSDLGRVRSTRRRGAVGGIAKQFVSNRNGYWVVNLHRPGGHAHRTVHGMVMESFVGPRPAGMDIRHLDGNPQNARLSNLAYGTRSENNLDKRLHGTDHNVRKTHCPQGHPYDEQNTYVLPSRPSARYCRTCQRARTRDVRARQRAERLAA
jgi:hypothetical protein